MTIDLPKFVSTIPLIGGVVHFVGTVACSVASGLGSITRDSLHTVGDRVYDVCQASHRLIDWAFRCGGGPPSAPAV